MEFEESEQLTSIRLAIREICAQFDEDDQSQIAPVPQEMVLNFVAEHVLGLPRSY